MMKKLFPAPLISLGLFVMWLLLNHSVSAGHMILALLLALGLPVLFKELRPQKVRVRHLGTALRLCFAVMVDTTQSNIAVVRFLLLPSQRRHPPAFVKIPLELRDPNALAVLAMIVCITPGTVWAELSLDRSALMLHVLEVDDAQAVIDHVKTRYERPLMEIFE
ncbi:Na+/H+ antiporter subunit E [Acidovorax sp. MR-S7]|jgi:multicomponent K+:H+ antiporter subunit E|uniref:Na+/H+ antiporter subunit E n=1 Tax=unclassified Acidovorax TaxID=2684926 RepID=UPI0003603591|nr:Na+/H+ antiporter subunit E [Acidovorax sp. MR-S7]